MLPCIAFARAVKGGFTVTGIEVPTTFALTLNDMTPDGNPILLAPNANLFVTRLENREDEILGIWTEKFKALRDECIKEAEEAVSGDNKEEAAAYLFAVSNLTDTLWLDCFRDVARTSSALYSNGYRLYKQLEEEVLATDGWVRGGVSGPLTTLIREKIAALTGITLTDSEIKQGMDNTPDCGDENCPVHGIKPDAFNALLDEELTRGESQDTMNGFKDTGLGNGTVFKETTDGIVVTNGVPDTDGDREEERLSHQRNTRNRDRVTAQ